MFRITDTQRQRSLSVWIILLPWLCSLLLISWSVSAQAPVAADPLRDELSSVWQRAQHSGASEALRAEASNRASDALTDEVASWLNYGDSKVRITADIGLGSGDKHSQDIGLDYLLPLKSWQDTMLFTQFSGHRWNDRNIVNLGLGWRHSFSPQLMAGGNLFYDQDLTRQHNRLGVGGELWSDRIRSSFNYYFPLSSWRLSHDTQFNDDTLHYDLYERAARGWDVNIATALTQHIAAKAGWFQWYGDKVDVTGSQSEASQDPYGLKLGLNWQPVPLLGVSAEQQFISDQSNNTLIGLQLNWQFGRKLSEMLDPAASTALPSLMQARNEFVTRNNNIVLAYKQQEKDFSLYFSPAEQTTQIGVNLLHQVQGGHGGVIVYSSSQPDLATVNASTGLVTPKLRGVVTITATEMANSRAHSGHNSASYQLTIEPAEIAPSVSEVGISGNLVFNSELQGTYTYHNNGGEDEAPALTQLRWYDKATMNLLQDGGKTYKVKAADLSKTIVFEVTPVNLQQVIGKAGRGEISPNSAITALRIDKLLTAGEIKPDGSVKFYAADASLQLLAVMKDNNGAPLADQVVYWHSQSQLGSLTQSSSRTDSNGEARVIIEKIAAGGEDLLTASLAPQASGAKARELQQQLTLRVEITQAQSVSIIAAPVQAQVATEHNFTVKVSDQHGAPLTPPVAVTWNSNGAETTSQTNAQGESTVTLRAPQQVTAGWTITARAVGITSAAKTVTLIASAVDRVELVTSRPQLDADSGGSATLTATAYDANGNPVADSTIRWQLDEASRATLTPNGDKTDAQGNATAQLSIGAGSPGGTAGIRTEIAGKTQNIAVPLHASPILTRVTLNKTADLAVGDFLTATAEVDENGGGQATLTYQWLRNQTAITNATERSYTLTNDDVAAAIAVKVTATNGVNKSTHQSVNTDGTVRYRLASPQLTVINDGVPAGAGPCDPNDSLWIAKCNAIEVQVKDTQGSPVANVGINAQAVSQHGGDVRFLYFGPTDADGKTTLYFYSMVGDAGRFNSTITVSYLSGEPGQASATVYFDGY